MTPITKVAVPITTQNISEHNNSLKNTDIQNIKMKNKPELLAPAGDFECLITAINAGADAVYFGIKNFNMRARAKNFKISDLPKIAKLCKSISKKIKIHHMCFSCFISCYI